jgi:hypothetical protein
MRKDFVKKIVSNMERRREKDKPLEGLVCCMKVSVSFKSV